MLKMFFFFFLSSLGREFSGRFCHVNLSRCKDTSLVLLQELLSC